MNNFEYAQNLESKIKEDVLKSAKSTLEEEFIETIFEKHLAIIPSQNENNLINIDASSHSSNDLSGISRKLSNIRLNLKDIILLAIETSINFEMPATLLEFVKLGLNILLKAYMASSIKITNNECVLLIYLHEKNAYETPVLEEKIYEEIRRGIFPLSVEDYRKSLNNLIRISSLIVVMEKIYLNEYIKLKY